MPDTLKLGTRGSPLALAQARMVAAAIEAAQRWPDGYVEVVSFTTTGDKVQDRPLSEIGGKGLWTKELDRAQLDRALSGESPFDETTMLDDDGPGGGSSDDTLADLNHDAAPGQTDLAKSERH